MAYGEKRKKTKAEGSQEDSALGMLCRWVNEADDATHESRELAERSRDYYDSKQWTDAEVRKLKAQKQAPTVINRIKPKMDALMGMEKAAKTTAKAYPRTPTHEKAAEAATEGIRFVLQDNSFDQIRSMVWEFLLIEGTGGCEVIAEPKGDDFRITLNLLMWDRIIYDPHSRKKDFSDAKYLGQVVWMDYEDAVSLYPEGKDVLENMISGSGTYEDKPRWMDNTRKRVKIVELYYRQAGEMKYACFTRGGFLKSPQVSPYKNEEGETEWPYELASLFVDREGGRYGACRQLLDVQDEINKRRSKALHLMSVRQVRLERGAVDDINKTRQELAKPDGVVETTPGMEFEVLKTGDMAAAQFNLLTEAKMEIDSVGANAATQGKEQRAMSGRALIERRNAGQTEVGPMFDTLRYWQQRVYRKVWNRVKQYWKAEKWIRVTDDENNLRWVGLNTPITRGDQILKDAQKQGVPPEKLAQIEMQIKQDPSMQVQVGTENDIAELDVDIIISEVPDILTQQAEDFQVLGEMVKSGFQMPPEAVILASPLSNKDKILKMMKEQPQIPPQIQEQMKQMQEEAQKLAQENQQLKQAQMQEHGKLQQRQMEMQAEFSLKQHEWERELQLAREKASAEIELKRQIAAADIELEKMKRLAQNDSDAEAAIEKIKSLILLHETKMNAAIQASQVEKEEEVVEEKFDTMSLMQQSHKELMSAVAMVIESLNRKKTVTATSSSGAKITAEVV